MLKRILAILLVLVMCASLMPLAGFAEDEPLAEELVPEETAEPASEPDTAPAPAEAPVTADDDALTDQVDSADLEEKINAGTNILTSAYIPDAGLRAAIKDTLGVSTLTAAEAKEVELLSCSDCGITDPTGLEYFTALRTLYISGNSIKSLNLTKNKNLRYLECEWNGMTSLNVSGPTKLETLYCGTNSLKALDVSNNTALEWLMCGDNSISTLNLSNNTALEMLNCAGNKLTKLDLSANTLLWNVDCHDNSLTSLKLAGAVTQLCCRNNRLTKLDLRPCGSLSYVDAGNQKKTDFHFSGWYTNSGCTVKWSGEPEANKLLYAKFTRLMSSCDIKLSYSSHTCTGSALKPAVTVKLPNGNTVSSSNYKVSYSNNTAVGTATVTVKAVSGGRYYGSATKTFKINPAATKLTLAENTSTGIKLTWNKVTGATGYKVYRSIGTGDFKLIRTITSGKTTSCTTTGSMTNGSRYRFKIVTVAEIDGTTYRSGYSNIKTVYRLSRPSVSSATNSGKGELTVQWSKNTKADGYQIKLTQGTSKMTQNLDGAGSNFIVFMDIASGSTLKVSVRSYKTVNGVKYYSAWSTAKSVEITY